jgi:hypothetical protein
MAEIIRGPAMKIQYDNATEDELENASSGLCNAALNKLFPSEQFIITGQYYFRDEAPGGQRFYADYVVERVWPNGRRATVLVVEVKPHHQTEAQDAESDDQAEDYARATLNQSPAQRVVYAAKFVGGACMFYWFSRTQPTLNPLSGDFMDIEDDYATIRGHVQGIQGMNVF